ncbi:MAG: hypothetical protein F6K11_23525 [Leptolyngbya sp. SIO3F4]|nr:hypothetical protein [Leptolyngbya sp. SIO3F4]
MAKTIYYCKRNSSHQIGVELAELALLFLFWARHKYHGTDTHQQAGDNCCKKTAYLGIDDTREVAVNSNIGHNFLVLQDFLVFEFSEFLRHQHKKIKFYPVMFVPLGSAPSIPHRYSIP